MKNYVLRLMSLAYVAGLVFMSSCGEGEIEEPVIDSPSIVINLTKNGVAAASPLDATPGDSVGFDIQISAPGGFNVYRLYISVEDSVVSTLEFNRNDLGLAAGEVSVSDALAEVYPASAAGQQVEYEFEVVDDKNQIGTATVIVNVTSQVARSYSAILLAAPTGDKTNKNFFSVSAGQVYSNADVVGTTDPVSATIDFGYFYGSTDLASIASPQGFLSTALSAQVDGWGTKNATVLKTTDMTAAQFVEQSTFADIDAAFEAGTLDANGVITGLAVGDVLAFETAGGIRGLIHVVEIKGTFNSNDYIKIDVLAQMGAAQ